MQTNPPDPASVAAGLTKRQCEALPFLDGDDARSPYDLKRLGQRGGFTVLEALRRRGIVAECGEQRGRLFAPHTTYKYRLTPFGEQVHAALQAKETK